MTIITKSISRDVFQNAVKTSKVRKSSVVNSLRVAIQELKVDSQVECSIHYQSYKNLQRELLADSSHYIIKIDTVDKNVVSIAVTTDASIIVDASRQFLANDKKYTLTDEQESILVALEQSLSEQDVELEQVASR